ncbi:unnamed protein product [Linum trigynum]|uniref:Uncharacterized protein n=1 Tax=Linum trigynum TaxID=586398 RepID=A0AAV2CSX0_9ROSI
MAAAMGRTERFLIPPHHRSPSAETSEPCRRTEQAWRRDSDLHPRLTFRASMATGRDSNLSSASLIEEWILPVWLGRSIVKLGIRSIS